MLHTKHNRNQGFALALTLFLIVILATVCFGALNVTTLDERSAVEDYKASRAFYAARAGVAYAKKVISESVSQNSTMTASQKLPLANGQEAEEEFSIVITPASDNASRAVRIWKVESQGSYLDATRKVIAFIEHETFAKFGYFTDEEKLSTSSTYIRFAGGDKLTGSVHTNGFFTVSGHPKFGGAMTSANNGDANYDAQRGRYKRSDNQYTTDNKQFYRTDGAQYNYTDNGPVALDDSPDFSFAGGQKTIALPTSTSEDIKTAAQADDAYFTGNYRVIFTEDGKAKFYKETTEKRLVNGRYQNVTYYKGLPQKAGDPDTPEKSLDTTKMPGICMYVKGKMEVSGDVKGRVTLSSTDNCYVVDDIQYVDDNNCVLGLTSENNIIVRTDKNVQRDLYLSAMLMALKGSFTVENYSSGRYRGQLHLFGGVVQKTRGAVATGTGSSTSTGYEKDYVYDPKLVTYPPLNFPNTGKYYLRYFIDKGSLGGV